MVSITLWIEHAHEQRLILTTVNTLASLTLHRNKDVGLGCYVNI